MLASLAIKTHNTSTNCLLTYKSFEEFLKKVLNVSNDIWPIMKKEYRGKKFYKADEQIDLVIEYEHLPTTDLKNVLLDFDKAINEAIYDEEFISAVRNKFFERKMGNEGDFQNALKQFKRNIKGSVEEIHTEHSIILSLTLFFITGETSYLTSGISFFDEMIEIYIFTKLLDRILPRLKNRVDLRLSPKEYIKKITANRMKGKK